MMKKLLHNPILIAFLVLGTFVSFEAFGLTNVAVTIATNTRLSSDLAFHYTFDSPGGLDFTQASEVRDVANSYHAALVSMSASSVAPGRLGQSLSFDGAADYFAPGTISETIYSIAFWIRADDITLRSILDLDGTSRIEINDTSQITTNAAGTTNIYVDGVAGSTITTGWHHVVLTNASGFPSLDSFEVGRANSVYLDGALDDVRGYSRVLTAGDIGRLYELGATTKISTSIKTNSALDNGLISHWTFDGDGIDNSQTASVRDRIGSNHGTPYIMGAQWKVGWDYRVSITVNSGQVSSTLSDFPVYVDLSDMPAAFFTNVQGDGDDIRVVEADGLTETPFELVSISTSTSAGELYFKADEISDAADTVFYMYYGNSGASGYAITDTYGAENVWVGFDMVHHLEDSVADSTSGGVLDSTSNSQDGTPANFSDGGGGATGASGKLGNAADFAGDDDQISFGSFTPGSAGTVSMWFNLNTINKNHRPYGGDDRYEFRFTSAGDVFSDMLVTGGAGPQAATVGSTGVWYYLGTTYDDSINTTKAFLDGALINTKTDANAAMGGPYTTYLGRSATAQYFDGLIDELRVSDSVRSDAWIETEYNNMSNPDAFYTVGTPTSMGTGSAYENLVSGRMGQALEFSTYDFVNVVNENPIVNLGTDTSLDLAFPFTISAWMHLNDFYTSNGGMVIGKGSEDDDSVQWALFIQQSGVPYFIKLRNDKTTPDLALATSAIDENEWGHYIFTVDASGNWVFYFNGQEDATGTFSNSEIVTTSDPGYMGAYYRSYATNDINSGFWGQLDDVRLYDRALSAEEARRLYGLGGTAHIGVTNTNTDGVGGRGLINHWTFDGVTGLDIGQAGSEVLDRVGGSDGSFGEVLDSSNAVPGKIGQGMQFDGVEEYVDFGNASGCVDGGGLSYCPETISFWLKADDITSRPIMELVAETSIEINASGQIITSGFSGTPTIYVDGEEATQITTGWHHVVVTDIPELTAFEIGRVGGSFFDGAIDDVRVFDYILTAEDAARLASI